MATLKLNLNGINELDFPSGVSSVSVANGVATVNLTGGGGGGVSSVAMTGDGVIFNAVVPGSPITTSGTLAPSLLSQSANQILAGPTTGVAAAPTFRSLVAADIPNLDASKITTGQLALARGGTNADLSATGGASQVLKQLSAGAAITVGQLAASDLSNGVTGSGSVVLNTNPSLSLTGTYTLAIGDATGNARLNISGSGNGMGEDLIVFSNASSGNSAGGQIIFQGDGSTSRGAIKCKTGSTATDAGGITIFANGQGTSSLDGQFTVNADGHMSMTGALIFTGNTGLAANGGTNFQMAGNFGSPVVGRIYVGDGTGWRLEFAKRVTATDTAVASINDSGNLTLLAKVTTYNNKATVGIGVTPVYATDSQTALTANYNAGAAKTLITSPTAGSVFRVSGVQSINRAATTSSTMPSLTLSWTDAGGIARTAVLVATSTTNTTAVTTPFSIVIHTNGSNVTVTSAGYASSGATSMQYSLGYAVEQLA